MKKNILHYFYCQSYQAFFMALILIDNGKDVTIISPTEDIIRTCVLMKLKYKKIESINHIQIVKNLKRSKLKIINLCRKICNDLTDVVLHFTHTQWDVFCFLFIDTFAKEFGEVNFYNFEYVYKVLNSPMFSYKYFKFKIIQMLINSYYDTNLVLKKISSHILFGIDDEFLMKNKIKIVDVKHKYYEEIEDVFRNIKLPMKPMKNLMLAQNIENNSYFTKASAAELNDFINQRKDIIIKKHPYSNEKVTLINNDEVPSYLPAELLYNNIEKSIISIYSTALINAAKFKKIKSISLLCLLEPIDIDFVNCMKNELIDKSDNQILFPKTYDELNKLL